MPALGLTLTLGRTLDRCLVAASRTQTRSVRRLPRRHHTPVQAASAISRRYLTRHPLVGHCSRASARL